MKLLWNYVLELWYTLRLDSLDRRAGELAGEQAALRKVQDATTSKLRRVRTYIASHASPRRLLP